MEEIKDINKCKQCGTAVSGETFICRFTDEVYLQVEDHGMTDKELEEYTCNCCEDCQCYCWESV